MNFKVDMSAPEILRNLGMGLLVLLMFAVLAFLYDRTQAVDLNEQNEVMNLLNEVKDIDSRWDIRVQRSRIDMDVVDAVGPGSIEAGDQALRDITRFASLTSSKALRNGLPELRSAIQLKSGLVQQFLTENRTDKTALRDVLGALAAVTVAAGRHAAPTLLYALDQIRDAAPQYFLHGAAVQRDSLLAATAQLGAATGGADDPMSHLQTALQVLLQHIPQELALYAKLDSLSTGPRLISLTLAFNSELEAALQENDRYRIYLVYYASALLVLLLYMGGKLRVANQTLEHRVDARTRELSDALRHLKESESQLIQSEKMSSLGQMVAGVAHEINTPLAYVKNSLGQVSEKLPAISNALGQTEQLLQQLRAGDNEAALAQAFQQVTLQVGELKQQHVVEELGVLVRDGLFGTGQMSEIVGNLKNFSRLDLSKVAHTNLNDCINSTLLLAKHQLKSVTVNRQFGEIPEITCAPSQINQVLLNLVTNAVQAMPDEKGTLTLTSRKEGEGVTVEVADNGSGIPPDVLPRIFDPFFTTKGIGKGTGLGLSISYKIVQEHGGKISVVSTLNEGTRFTVWLPLTPPADAQLEG